MHEFLLDDAHLFLVTVSPALKVYAKLGRP